MLKNVSLRFWITLSMLITLTPLALSAVGTYGLLNYGVIAPFHDVVKRKDSQILPVQQLRILTLKSMAPVDEFVVGGKPGKQSEYQALRAGITALFLDLDESITDDAPGSKALLNDARAAWAAADGFANELFSMPLRAADARVVAAMEQRFHDELIRASDELEVLHDRIVAVIDADAATAAQFLERSLWMAGIAGGISLICIALGVHIIGRIMSTSVDRLVQGANHFAEGNRSHRIHVELPPELTRVAQEFNHMIGRIHEAEEVLNDMARQDELTGLANRRAFEAVLPDMMGRAKRFEEQFTLLAIDIDHFKQVNDTHGHAAGDEVLRAVARTMKDTMRDSDRVFRVGGEEFAVLLPRTDGATARLAAERIRQAVEMAPVSLKSTEIAVTVSIGMASTLDFLEKSDLLEAADAALYRAKHEGRNRVAINRPGAAGSKKDGFAA
ncbi:diguanylate cyclase [Hoeflea sp.]|uniref:diguanylate cyclase n=1 Tax=Hoeflea sp. TaxID=1940281 RepID=UPI00374947EC